MPKQAAKSPHRTQQFDKCPFCGGQLAQKYRGIKDRLMTTHETFSISECENCRAAVLNPAPIEASSFYPTNYLSAEEGSQPAAKPFDIEKWYRYNQYAYDFRLLENATGQSIGSVSSYVDIGCGSGERVTFASDSGCHQSFGVDKFDFAKSKSKQEAKIINSEILDFKPKDKFQVASLFHVLEHLDNPHETLAHIKNRVLKEDGYLIIQVPNYGSFESRIFKSRWFGLDAPRHYWHFNEKALRLLLQESGYKVEAVYQLNAPLHPVTIVPSLFKELDVQRIWVSQKYGGSYKKFMKLAWAALTVVTIPLAFIQNLFNRSSMLTIVASNK
jgi:SAM-dependent methyltransferase